MLLGQFIKKGEEAVGLIGNEHIGPTCLAQSDLREVALVNANMEPDLEPPVCFSW